MKQQQATSEFKLSDPGVSYSEPDSNLMMYLQSYNLPYPPLIRYGNIFFESKQPNHRVKIFGQAWLPAHPIGTVFIVHGFSEHTGNYSRLIHNFLDAHYAVAMMDLRGHGLSEGTRGHTDSPNCYAEDLEQWIGIAYPKLAPSTPIYLWGHSLGAQLCLQLLLRKNLPRSASAVCLTSPMLGFPKLSGLRKILMQLVPILAKTFPVLAFPKAIPDTVLSSEKEYLAAREEDPLIHSVITAQWIICTKKNIEYIQTHAKELQNLAPVLMMLAGNEYVTDLLAARGFAFHALSSLKHKVIEFPGLLHELEKDSARARIISETLAWFSSHPSHH